MPASKFDIQIGGQFVGQSAFSRAERSINRIVTAGVGFYALARGAREVVSVLRRFEQFQFTLDAAAGSIRRGGEEMEFVRQVAGDYGLRVDDLVQNYGRLLAANSELGISLDVTRDLFSGIAGAAATFGLNAYEVQLVLSALTQIANKGVVSMEELRRQLGERLPGAVVLAANSLDLTTQELIKLVETGGLTAREFFNAFSQELDVFDASGKRAADRIGGREAGLVNSLQQFILVTSEATGIGSLYRDTI